MRIEDVKAGAVIRFDDGSRYEIRSVSGGMAHLRSAGGSCVDNAVDWLADNAELVKSAPGTNGRPTATFRQNQGILAHVKRVLAYDLHSGRACILFHSEYCPDFFDLCLPDELELISGPEGTFGDVKAELRSLAEFTTGSDD